MERRPWLLPALGAVLIVVLGPVVNVATDLQTSWIAWAVYGLLAVASVLVTVLLARRQGPSKPASNGVVIRDRSPAGSRSEAQGLVMLTRETTHPDGSRTKTVECFSEEVAIRFFGKDFNDDEEQAK